MIRRPIIAILDDSAEERARLVKLCERQGVEPVSYPSAKDALASLRNAAKSTPSLFVCDYLMYLSHDQSQTVDAVLRHLHDHVPQCVTIVYSATVGTHEVRSAVLDAHPGAILVDKCRDGGRNLVRVIDDRFGRCFGDLRIDAGRVVHSPSGKTFPHPVAFELMQHSSPNDTAVKVNNAEVKALRRFRTFLTEVGSEVVIRCVTPGVYRLSLQPDTVP
jgi:CheY-like chemotaxis protein